MSQPGKSLGAHSYQQYHTGKSKATCGNRDMAEIELPKVKKAYIQKHF